MTPKTLDLNTWLDTYKETFSSFAKAQQDGFSALERFARFNYAVAGDCLEAGLAQARAALDARAAVGTQAVADLLAKQAELSNQLSERLRARAQEFSTLASEVQDSVKSFATEAASRAAGTKKAA
jgi:hypothetical protein